MFGKLLASVGIGSASVDARIPDRPVRPGERLAGEVHLQGGSQDQAIKAIYMALVTGYLARRDDRPHLVHHELTRGHVAEHLTLRAGERRVLPFGFQVPWETPCTTPGQRLHLRTGLDSPWAVDPSDRDEIEVLPDPLVEAVLTEAAALGFRHTLESGRCRRSPYRVGKLPFVQEFELRPTGAWRSRLDEIELTVVQAGPRGVTVMVQVDRRGGLLDARFDLDERLVRLQLDRHSGYPQGALERLLHQAMGH